MTLEQLKDFTLINDSDKLNLLFTGLNNTFTKFDINTPQRQRHFLSQVSVESGNFTHLKENLNYSTSGLLLTFPTHFNTQEANAYARQPIKIANRVYANRLGNSDESSGDGYRYCGRGFIMVTGKDNYIDCGHSLNLNLVDEPELLEQADNAVLSAGWFWNGHNLNAIADTSGNDVSRITKIINGGLTGLNDRQHQYNRLLTILVN